MDEKIRKRVVQGRQITRSLARDIKGRNVSIAEERS